MIHEHEFSTLTARWERTAARLPFVTWQDTIAGPGAQEANLHRDFCSLYVVRRGRGTHVIDGVRYAIARGDVYAMGPGMSHYFEDCDSLITETFHFQPTLFDRESRDTLAQMPGFHSLFVTDPPLAIDPPANTAPWAPRDRAGRRREPERWLHLTPTRHAQVQAAIAELRTEYFAGAADAAACLLTRALFFRLLVHLSRFYRENPRPSAAAGDRPSPQPPAGFAGSHEETIAAAVRYMEERFARRLRIEQIAAQVFLSPDRFTAVFTSVMGRTPRDYLRHLRIEHARMLLSTTDLPIGQVSAAAGFTEAAYFTRVLRAATGQSPTQYRKSHRVK